jgi:hypothetical protein
VVDIKTNDKK